MQGDLGGLGFGLVCFFLRHRVISTAAPGVATADALDAQPEAFQWAILLDSLQGVLRAGRSVTAGGGRERRDARLVPSYEPNHHLFHSATFCCKVFKMRCIRCCVS